MDGSERTGWSTLVCICASVGVVRVGGTSNPCPARRIFWGHFAVCASAPWIWPWFVVSPCSGVNGWTGWCCSWRPTYGELLSRYSRLLRQRSSLLRRHGGASPHHHLTALLDAYDQQMANLGARLHRRRQRALLRLDPLARSWQKRLSGEQEILSLLYHPGTELPPGLDVDQGNRDLVAWQEALRQQLAHQRQVELRLGTCRIGPQRDEVMLQLDGQAARRYGSSGQQRCMVLALKMAEVDLVAQVSGEAPVLLLDDVLAELDPDRQLMLLEAIGHQQQCLLSTTHLDRFVGAWRRDAQCIGIRQDGEGSMLSPFQ